MNQKRQQLQHNALGDWIAEKMTAAEPYAAQIAVGSLVAIGLVVGVIWYSSMPDTESAKAWDEYLAAISEPQPDVAMETVATSFASTKAGLWAKQSGAEMSLRRGCDLMFRDRDEAGELFTKAEAAFKEVEAAAGDKELRIRAQFGLAKVLEETNKPEEAKAAYEKTAELAGDSAIGKLAQAAVARMNNPADVALLAWFSEQAPKLPAPMPPGMGGMGGPSTSLPMDLPERPDIDLPTDFGSSDPLAPGIELPPAGDSPIAPPATEAPAAETPAEEKPAEPAAPAPESPAAETPAEAPATEEQPAEDKPVEEAPADAK